MARSKALDPQVDAMTLKTRAIPESPTDESEQTFTRVYVMGETKFGQLGFMLDSQQDSVIRMPKLCNYNVLVKEIACGEVHTHILSQDGFVYSMGINHYGVLGLSVSEM